MQELKQKTHFIHSLQNLLSHSRFSLSTKQHIHMYSLQRAHTHTHTHIQPSKLSHTFIKITQHYIYIYIYMYIYHKLINPQSPQHTHGLNKLQITGLLLVLARSPPLFSKKREVYIICIWCLFFFFFL
jgi:hypothetical protein